MKSPGPSVQNSDQVDRASETGLTESGERVDLSRRDAVSHGPGTGWRGLLVVSLSSVLLLSGTLAYSQVYQNQTRPLRSSSGQFVVQSGLRVQSAPNIAACATNAGFIRLDPALVVVTCERIKSFLYEQLQAPPPNPSKVFLRIRAACSTNEPVFIAAEQFRDGWQYKIEFPEVLDSERYVAAITRVLLLQYANVRDSNRGGAELPMWLTEGMALQILSSRESQILLAPPDLMVNGLAVGTNSLNFRRENPLAKAHADLLRNQPLSFQQLSWPGDSELGEGIDQFRSSSHLLVNRLLALENGPACLRQFLAELPRFLNWQFALLSAFHDHFRRPLDVEKWWALNHAYFTGRELTETWGPAESWQKLDAALHSSIQIRGESNELPSRGEATLQTVLRDWPTSTQNELIQAKVHELNALRLRMARDLVPVVDGYSGALQALLDTRNDARFIAKFRKQAHQRKALQTCLKDLDALDARRMELRPANDLVRK